MNNTTTPTPDEIHVMGESSVSTPVFPEQEVDPTKELEAVRSGTVSIRTEDYARDLEFQQQVGRVQGFQAAASGLSLAVIQWFSAMKASGEYKGRNFTDRHGTVHQPKNFEELCDAMEFSRRTIDEALQNYATFGEERLTEIRNLGLTVKDTRKIRKAIKDVDEDTKKEIFRELKSSTPEDLRVTIDVICAQHAKAQADNKKLEKEAAKLKEKVETLEKDKETQQKVAQERNDQIATLKEELIVATSSAIADIEVRKMKKNAKNREILDEKCRDALLAVAELAARGSAILADEETSEETATYVHERISAAVQGMAAHILGAGIDVDLAAELVPDFGEEALSEADNQETTD